ncbi:MAG: asparagine synthase (glutamine-hydrolyzing) [Desulfobacula sp.]|nr:asparagine synthase (glutamine-hydrolyzing) [Desulfobacula sp.]
MCGIAGKVALHHRPDVQSVQRITRSLSHRGPDAEGIMALDNHVVFGHRRLSIIDLSTSANQPMQDDSKRYTITYNGEVYNYLELRKVLLDEGVHFRTQSDTEVVLYAYARWGVKCFEKFNGMFALAIWDSRENILILARDRFGKKPIFYTLLNDEITFASELTALLEDTTIKKKVSLSIPGLNHYLALGYILSPLTIYSEINKLESATYISFQDDKIQKHKYWDYRACFDNQTKQTEEDVAHQLDALLEQAVKYRLISDVPVGAFLSGGLDSSGITAYAKRHIPYDLHTFCVGFSEASYNESADASIIADYLCTIHHELVPDLKRNKETIVTTIDCYDEPFSDTSLIPMVLVSKFASQFVKVVLSGDGADEIFGGYLTYQADLLKKRFQFLPPSVHRLASMILRKTAFETQKKTSLGFKLKQFAKGLTKSPQYAHYVWRELHDENERIALIGNEHCEEIKLSHPFLTFLQYYEGAGELEPMNQHLYVDANTWLTDDILVKLDRATMAFGLEARTPFLDVNVAAYAASIPPAMKIGKQKGKIILKKVLSKYLPASTIGKKKSGFNAPVNAWFNNYSDNEFRYFNKYVWNQKWRVLKNIV